MIERITNHPIWVLIFSLIVALPFVIHAPKVKTVDNVDYFTLENDPDVQFYDAFKDVFGNDEFFVIAYEKEDLFTRENLELLKALTVAFENLDEIREVRSLANVNDTIGENDYFIVAPFLDSIPEESEALQQMRRSALSNPLYVKNLISTEGDVAAIVISVYEKPDDPGYRKRVIEQCQRVLERFSDRTGKVYMSGWTTTNLYLSQYMKKDVATFIPVTYLFITLAVFFFFRSIQLTLIAVINISVCMGATMGLFYLFDMTLNNVTSIVPPVVMALALCDTVHIFSHLDGDLLERLGSKKKTLTHLLKNLLAPCFLTTLTTAVGFASLMVSDIPPIKDFARIASIGMIFEFLFSFSLLPALLLIFGKKKNLFVRAGNSGIYPILIKIISLVTSRHKLILLVGLLSVVFSLWAISLVKVETNLLHYFKPGTPVRMDTAFVEEHLSGINTLDISLLSNSENSFKSPEALRLIEKVQAFINTLDGVDKTMSFVDFIKDMNASFHNERPEYYIIPDSHELIAQYLLMYDSDDIDDFVNDTYDRSRIAVRVAVHSTLQQKQILSKIQSFLGTLDQGEMDIQVTGRIVQDVNTINAIVKGQVVSLGLATGVIAVIMLFVFRSIKLGLLSLLPNLFPIVINFGIMGVFGVALNEATALIAAVSLGIAVDDTIHFLIQYQRNKKNGVGMLENIEDVIKRKGTAILLSSLILSIGFGVMAFSRFVPTMHFGILSAVIMLSAVVADLLLLPAMLMMKR